MRVIAFNSPTEGSFPNVSFSDLPGAFILSAVREPYWLADALIHELLHNRLFFINERGEGADGTIYIAPTNNTVYALTFNGTAAVQKWTFAVDFCSGNFPSAIGADGSMLLDGGATHTRYSTTLCSEGSPLLRQMMRNASKLLPHLGRLSSRLHILTRCSGAKRNLGLYVRFCSLVPNARGFFIRKRLRMLSALTVRKIHLRRDLCTDECNDRDLLGPACSELSGCHISEIVKAETAASGGCCASQL